MSDVTTGGETLGGRYRITRRLGRGGMAEVWAAHDEVLRRDVAVKVFHLGGDEVDAQRAAAEMHTLAALSHPNLVAVYDAGTEGDRTFLVMELVAGPSLAERLAPPAAVGSSEAVAIAVDVAAGLAHVHRRGIVHRDVKPANILLPAREHGDGPFAKLADFGIAQHSGQDRLTATGMTIGTARYLAPEQVTGRPVGPPADVYALGLVLLETLGCSPGWDGTPVEIAMARLTSAPVVPPGLGPVWAPLLTAMTAADPAARPTASAVLDALRRAPNTDTEVVGAPVPPAATSVLTTLTPQPATHRARRTAIAAVVAVVVAASVVTGFALTRGSPDHVAPGGVVSSSGVEAEPATSASVVATATTASSAPAPPVTPTPTSVASTPAPAGPGGGGHQPPGQTKTKKSKP